MAYFPSDKYTFDCKYVSFCIELNTFIQLKIANSFLFLIFPVCYLYVMSQSTFHVQIRPRPLLACLNCAAYLIPILDFMNPIPELLPMPPKIAVKEVNKFKLENFMLT